jgi:antitoxin Phd
MGKSNARVRPPRWKMEDAKAQFSRLAKLAREIGPQRVTHRGQDSVVVVAAEEFDRLASSETGAELIRIMANSPLRDAEMEAPSVRSPVRKPEF